jgi:hypothetical protein
MENYIHRFLWQVVKKGQKILINEDVATTVLKKTQTCLRDISLLDISKKSQVEIPTRFGEIVEVVASIKVF